MKLKQQFKTSIAFMLPFFLICSATVYAIKDARLLRSPDIRGDKIVFVYGGDLWKISLSGGNALQLTSHPGYETSPYFSPDGKWIAFSGEYDGNRDVYIIPNEGGIPKRLTFHPVADTVTGWSHDGKYVLFSSIRSSYHRFQRIFKVSITGGIPEVLPMPMAWLGAMSPDGKNYAYTSLSNRHSFQTWRRYRGGNAPFIWIFNFGDNSVKKIPHPKCNDSFPRWMGDEVYFLSDRDRVMNLYAFNNKTNELRQITYLKGADIKTFGAAEGKIIIEQEGYLHSVETQTGRIKKITIDIPSELTNTRPRFTKAGRLIFGHSLSPTGKRVAFEARGEIVTIPVKKGDIRNLTNTPGAAERLPAWSPDGKKIAFFCELKGEYVLKIIDQKGEKEPQIIDLKRKTYYDLLEWSPDSKKILFIDHRQTIYYLDIDKGKPVLVDTETKFLSPIHIAWSPDSNWLAYTKTGSNEMRAIYFFNVQNNKSFQITDGLSDAHSPDFDKNGKYLYFAASTNQAFDVGWVDLSEYPHQPVSSIYAVVLSKKESSPFWPESDEEEEKAKKKEDNQEKGKKEKVEKGEKKDEPKPIQIDINGIGNRIVAFNLPPRPYFNLWCGEKGKLYYGELIKTVLSEFRNRYTFNLHYYDMKKREDKVLLKGIDTFQLSADGKKLLYNKKRFKWYVTDAGKPEPGKGLLKTEQIEVYSVPRQEWRQMLFEAWRINREYFYDPGMHGQNWPAIWKQYKQYLPYIAHRADLTYVIGQMIGELCVGHAYVGGGAYPQIDRVEGGLLGADYEIINGYYRIKKIYLGENWNPDLRSPLTEPGVTIKAGDYILAINGKPVKASDNIFSFFQKTAKKQICLTINSKPSMKGSRTETVVPIASEFVLRLRDWIEANRRKVEKMSNGTVGYVYLPNTSIAGHAFFNRYYFAHLDKQAVVLDERFNGGGYAADYIIDNLNRPLLSWWQPRWGRVARTPQASILGPKVMIINEYAGSGGDYMPWAFRERGLGKLVGKRTWGGLVGITGYPRLMDGGYVTAPSIAYVNPEGKFSIENEGVVPDIEVEHLPAKVIPGGDPQLEMAIKVVLEELKKNPSPIFKRDAFPRGR